MCRALSMNVTKEDNILKLKEMKKTQLQCLYVILGSLINYCKSIQKYIETVDITDKVQMTNHCLMDEEWGFINLDENMTEDMYLEQRNTYNKVLLNIKSIKQIIELYYDSYSKISVYISNRNIFTNLKYKIDNNIKNVKLMIAESYDSPLISMIYDFTQIFNELYNNSRIQILSIV